MTLQKTKMRFTESELSTLGYKFVKLIKCRGIECDVQLALYEKENRPPLYLTEGLLEVHTCG